MRPKYLNFEDLVLQNKEDLLADKRKVEQLEMRLEKKQFDSIYTTRKNIS